MQQQYNNPKLPFTAPIESGLHEDMTITIKGSVLSGASRFQVDFKRGEDIALHFNPRYGLLGLVDYVVCNTLQGGKWNWESWSRSPLPRGQSFTLKFVVNRKSYGISVNGHPFLNYDHCIPANSVDSIFIDGGVEIESIAIQNPTTSDSQPQQL